MTFQMSALPMHRFAPLFALDDEALAAHRARRLPAPAGAPCRVSLIDATPGEPLLLVNYRHQPAESPFRSSHAIYVREDAVEATPALGEVPPSLRTRTLSLRGFGAGHEIVAAELVEGNDAAPAIAALFTDQAVAYIHAHYARYGCYAARIDRA